MKNQLECQCQDVTFFQSTILQTNRKTPLKKERVKQKFYHVQTSDQQVDTQQFFQNSVSQQKIVYRLQIFVLILLMTLCLFLILNYDNLFQLQGVRNQNIVSPQDISIDQFLELKYKFCPDPSITFHVNFNQKEKNIQYKSTQFNQQISFCKTPVIGDQHLIDLISKWNFKYPNQLIKTENLENQEKKQDWLVLLKLYFSGGIYVSRLIPYSQIDQRLWKYVLSGFETIFIDYSQINEKGIYVPDNKKFMRTRFPYSPQIKYMIEQLINQKDILQECKQRQCLIIKSL